MGKKKKLEKQEKLKKEKKTAKPKSSDTYKKADRDKKADKEKKADKKKRADKPKVPEHSGEASAAAAAEAVMPAAGTGAAETKAAISADRAALEVSSQRDDSKQPQQSQKSDSRLAFGEIYRALGDSTRMQIVTLLREQELCAGDLLKSVNVVQSTLSHHMKILVDAGVVKCRKQGKWSYYSLNRSVLAAAGNYILGL